MDVILLFIVVGYQDVGVGLGCIRLWVVGFLGVMGSLFVKYLNWIVYLNGSMGCWKIEYHINIIHNITITHKISLLYLHTPFPTISTYFLDRLLTIPTLMLSHGTVIYV